MLVIACSNEKTHLANQLSGARHSARASQQKVESLQGEMLSLRAQVTSYADEIKSVCCRA